MKLKILITLIIFTLIFSCQNRAEEFNSEYLIGEWTSYKAIEKANGIERENPKILKPIRQVFKKNGATIIGKNNIENSKWKITKDKTLMIGSEDVFFEYIPEIESHSKMKLKLIFENKETTFYYERGWNE